jgi:hypothetical protein
MATPAKEHLEGVPKLWVRQYRRSLEGVSGRAAAIKMKCYECVNFTDIKHAVYDCAADGCPLWMYRPKGPHARPTRTS